MKTPFFRFTARAILAAACCQAADLYRVSGVVVNSQTGAPDVRVRMVVVRSGSAVVEARQETGGDGRFSFDLPEGHYDLLSGTRDDAQPYGCITPDSRLGSAIVTGPGHDNSNLVFRRFPLGAISGRIVDDAGEPVEGAVVQLIQSRVVSGRQNTDTLAWAKTDDRGQYRFGRLRGSVYYLSVSGRPWYVDRSRFSDPEEASATYATVYYPGSSELSNAAPLVLEPGEEARADFAVRTIPAVRSTSK